ncbi:MULTISPECIES: DUF4245 domain-containing protein [unclassified Luteococcus]|uniref:DUF4245 domain-containing protein n=1 Tax=unclassified Luteococcus TaxID=2639923 RepID=UPI00313CE471
MRNTRATGRDMIISLAVILVPALAIYYWFARIPDEPQVPAADWKPVVADARTEASFQVLAPSNLPETWKPIRARYGNDELQLGFLSPETVYHEVKQRLGANQPEFVKSVTREARPDGESTVGGKKWTRMVTEDDRTRCLVNSMDKPKPTTTVVCADTSYEGVEAFASTLS